MFDFDLIVIGGGSAGFSAAGRAVANGARVALIEAGKLGGDCPNKACVPTKILLRSAEILNLVRNAGTFGVNVNDVSFDLHKIMERKNRVVEQLTGDRLQQVLDRRGISLFTDRARFKSGSEIEVDGRKISGAKFVIATGSVVQVPPIAGLDKAGYITSDSAVDINEMPSSIIIIGGGAVGVEFAQIFNGFGVKTTIVEAADRLVLHEDDEISQLLAAYLKEEGIEVIVGAKVRSVGKEKKQKIVEVEDRSGKRSILAEEVMVATGRAPGIEGLNLDAAGVQVNSSGIVVDDSLRTSAKNIWACGDVTGKLMYTHVATYQGDLAGYNSTVSVPDQADLSIVPRVTFCDPEVAGVGLTEAEARRVSANVQIGRMPYRYLGKSLIIGERRGLVKLIVDGSSRRIIGGHIIGGQAGELIHEIAVAIKSGISVESLAETIHVYPTFAEGIEAAAADVVVKTERPSHDEQAA